MPGSQMQSFSQPLEKDLRLPALAFVADCVAKIVFVRAIVKLAHRTSTHWDDLILRHRILHPLSHLAPVFVIHF